jgi:hypothetical protein
VPYGFFVIGVKRQLAVGAGATIANSTPCETPDRGMRVYNNISFVQIQIKMFIIAASIHQLRVSVHTYIRTYSGVHWLSDMVDNTYQNSQV